MYILAVCDNPEIAGVMKIINTIILLIRIAIPIILIVVLSIDFMGAIKTGDKDLLKEKTNGAVKKIIAATLIFLIPSFVNLIVKLSNPSNEYLSCLSIKSDADIQTVYSKKAEELVSKAESTKTLSDYSSAKIIVNKMSSSAEKDSYNSRLDAVYTVIQDRMDEENKEDQTSGGSTDTNNDVKGTYVSPVKSIGYLGSQNDTYCTYANGTRAIIHDNMIDEGTPVYASFDGTATFTQNYCTVNGKSYLWSYGNKIVINGNNGEGIVMGHFSAFVINGSKTTGSITATCHQAFSSCGAGACSGGTKSTTVGTQTVKAGDLIGYSGNTGNSGGPHLHVELKNPNGGGCVVDPWHDYFGL